MALGPTRLPAHERGTQHLLLPAQGRCGDGEFPSIFHFYEATGGRATITVDGLGQLALDNG